MIRGPKNAHPTPLGWVHDRTGEKLKNQRITDAQIAEWYGRTPPSAPAPVMLTEADPLETMTKAELEEIGREHGVELDRRKSKVKLVETVRNLVSK